MKKILQVYEMFTSYDGTTFVYALSYSLLLALAPLTALLVVFFRRSPEGLASILDFAEQYIPQDLLSPFIDFFLGNSPVELIPLIFFIVVSLWVASRAMPEHHDDQHRADDPRNQRRDRRTFHAHAQTVNQNRVADDIERIHDQRRHH